MFKQFNVNVKSCSLFYVYIQNSKRNGQYSSYVDKDRMIRLINAEDEFK